jgi:hypothetical protein
MSPIDPETEWEPQPDEWWTAVVKLGSAVREFMVVILSNGDDVFVSKKKITLAPVHTFCLQGAEASARIAPNTKAGASRWVALEVQIAGKPKAFTEVAEITTWYQNETGSYGSGRLLPCGCPIMIAWVRDKDKSLKVGDVVNLNIMFLERRGNYIGVDAEKVKDGAPQTAQGDF